MYSQNVFIQGSFWIYQVQNPTVDTKTKYLFTVICPQKLTHAHNVFLKSLNFLALELIF